MTNYLVYAILIMLLMIIENIFMGEPIPRFIAEQEGHFYIHPDNDCVHANERQEVRVPLGVSPTPPFCDSCNEPFDYSVRGPNHGHWIHS